MKGEKPIPSTVKFSLTLQKKIDEAAEKTGLPKQEVIRLCTAIGLEDLRRLDWDIAGALSRAADCQLSGNAPRLKVAPTELKKKLR